MKYPHIKFLVLILLALAYFKALGYSLYAMNLPSDLFAGLGVFGVVIATAALIYLLRKLWRNI